jgi:hypothetical protein
MQPVSLEPLYAALRDEYTIALVRRSDEFGTSSQCVHVGQALQWLSTQVRGVSAWAWQASRVTEQLVLEARRGDVVDVFLMRCGALEFTRTLPTKTLHVQLRQL